MSVIKLKSSDGEIFETEMKIAKCSATIKTMLEDCNIRPEPSVPLLNVNADILRLVLKWADFHKDDPAPVEEDEDNYRFSRTDIISSWNADFLKVDMDTLFALLLAANYLNIQGLINVTSQILANMIKGKSTAEIRKTFIVKKELLVAEKEQVRNENDIIDELSKE